MPKKVKAPVQVPVQVRYFELPFFSPLMYLLANVWVPI
jgi:hypothetical protein